MLYKENSPDESINGIFYSICYSLPDIFVAGLSTDLPAEAKRRRAHNLPPHNGGTGSGCRFK